MFENFDLCSSPADAAALGGDRWRTCYELQCKSGKQAFALSRTYEPVTGVGYVLFGVIGTYRLYGQAVPFV